MPVRVLECICVCVCEFVHNWNNTIVLSSNFLLTPKNKLKNFHD